MSDKENRPDHSDHLEDLFAVARRDAPPMPEKLQAAILQDAAAVQMQRIQQETAVVPGRAPGIVRLWRQFSNAIGGWPALGGLAAAGVAGLWIGLAPPAFLPDPAEQFIAISSGSQLLTDAGYDVTLLMGDEVLQ